MNSPQYGQNLLAKLMLANFAQKGQRLKIKAIILANNHRNIQTPSTNIAFWNPSKLTSLRLNTSKNITRT